MSTSNSISINILGRDYQISCPPSEEEALRQSAQYLDKQMNMVKSRGSTLSYEKIAVMTALNLSHELLQKSQQASTSESDSAQDIMHLEAKIESALQTTRHIEP